MSALLECGCVRDEGTRRRAQQGLPLALPRVQEVLHRPHWYAIRGNTASVAGLGVRDLESMLQQERNFGAATFTRDGDYAQIGALYSSSHSSWSGRGISA